MFVAAQVCTSAAKALITLPVIINAATGSAEPDNAVLTFARILTIHVTCLLFLNDPSLPDRQQTAKQMRFSEPPSRCA